jgi:CBS-domain-containing membrane protein
MKEQEKIYTQHSENMEWANKLKFYKEELEVLKTRLAEITSKNNNQEVLKEVEHFQNQFIIQRNNIDTIAHEVKMNEEKLMAEIKSNPVAADHRKVEYHTKEKDMVNSFEKNMNEIRSEFNRFASKWM